MSFKPSPLIETKNVNVTLGVDVIERLDAMAKAADIQATDVIRQMIRHCLNEAA